MPRGIPRIKKRRRTKEEQLDHDETEAEYEEAEKRLASHIKNNIRNFDDEARRMIDEMNDWENPPSANVQSRLKGRIRIKISFYKERGSAFLSYVPDENVKK